MKQQEGRKERLDCLEGIACRGGADGKINHQESAYKRQRKVVETGVGKKESTVQKRTKEEKEKVKVETTKTISTVPVIVDSGKNKRGGALMEAARANCASMGMRRRSSTMPDCISINLRGETLSWGRRPQLAPKTQFESTA